jgi:hypothetical protein
MSPEVCTSQVQTPKTCKIYLNLFTASGFAFFWAFFAAVWFIFSSKKQDKSEYKGRNIMINELPDPKSLLSASPAGDHL